VIKVDRAWGVAAAPAAAGVDIYRDAVDRDGECRQPAFYYPDQGSSVYAKPTDAFCGRF
jgi:hypothetical protein